MLNNWIYANAKDRTCTSSWFSTEVVKVSPLPLYTALKHSMMEDLCSRYPRPCRLKIITSPIFFNCTLPSFSCHPIIHLILNQLFITLLHIISSSLWESFYPLYNFSFFPPLVFNLHHFTDSSHSSLKSIICLSFFPPPLLLLSSCRDSSVGQSIHSC